MIIPTLHRLAGKPTTHSYEVIVADGGSTDGTPEIARRNGARTIECTRGRARQMNAGASVARGEFMYFLHADTLPPADWLPRLSEDPAGRPASFRLRFSGQRGLSWLRLYGFFTRFDIDAFRFGDQSLWVSREDFHAVGGFPDWQLLEDNELVRRLRRHRGGFRVMNAYVTTSPRRYERNGPVYTQLVYTMLYALARLGLSQRRLAGLYKALIH